MTRWILRVIEGRKSCKLKMVIGNVKINKFGTDTFYRVGDWIFDAEALETVIIQLQNQWTEWSVKVLIRGILF